MKWVETNTSAMVSFREMRGVSQRGLAKMLGVDNSTISLIESGKRNPSPGLGQRITDALGVPFGAIFKEYPG